MLVSPKSWLKTFVGVILGLATVASASAYGSDRYSDRDSGRYSDRDSDWNSDRDSDRWGSSKPPTAYYVLKPLVSDGFVSAPYYDPLLLNPWGLAFSPTSYGRVGNSNTAVSTRYDGAGRPQGMVVDIPGADDSSGRPTGMVYNGTNNFVITKNGLSGAGRYIFASYDGTISAWAPNVDQTNAVLAYEANDFSEYTGLALAHTTLGSFLYAADFYNGRVDVFNSTFQRVTLPTAFLDPLLPAGYMPFGIQNLRGNIYVSYAQRDANGRVQTGAGLGVVNVFNAQGILLRRVATAGPLNAPWGMAIAPSNFGTFSNALLVANFGDGRISAFGASNGSYLGQMRDQQGQVFTISGLRGIAFGNGYYKQPTNTLFFTSGPNDELSGLYGRIDWVTSSYCP